LIRVARGTGNTGRVCQSLSGVVAPSAVADGGCSDCGEVICGIGARENAGEDSVAGGETGTGGIARGAGVGARVIDCGVGWACAGLGERSWGILCRSTEQMPLTIRRTRNALASKPSAVYLVGSFGLLPRIRERLGRAPSSARASGGNTESKPTW